MLGAVGAGDRIVLPVVQVAPALGAHDPVPAVGGPVVELLPDPERAAYAGLVVVEGEEERLRPVGVVVGHGMDTFVGERELAGVGSDGGHVVLLARGRVLT